MAIICAQLEMSQVYILAGMCGLAQLKVLVVI